LADERIEQCELAIDVSIEREQHALLPRDSPSTLHGSTLGQLRHRSSTSE
jgi:hypothetical protein